MNADHPPAFAVVYGDADTVNNHTDLVREVAENAGLDIKMWHSDRDGTRGVDALDGADGLVSALSDCARLSAVLFVPFPVDMPGERTWRLVAHWLNCRGLRLQLGPAVFCWEQPVDEVDFAVRRTLDAAHALDVAVVARRAVPTLETLLEQITADRSQRVVKQETAALDSEPRFRRLRARRDRDLAAGRQVPAEPDPAAHWPERCRQAHAFAEWLQLHTSQSVIAEVLNATGCRPRRGDRWTQPMISRLLRGGYALTDQGHPWGDG